MGLLQNLFWDTLIFAKNMSFVFFEWLPIAFVSFMSDVEKLKTSFFLLT